MNDGEPIYHPWLNKSIEKAQTKVEERNFEIRKHLLEYDDVLNQQRKFIYEQRDAILEDRNLKERVNIATNDMVFSYLDKYKDSLRREPQAALKELIETLKGKFNYILKPEDAKYVDSRQQENNLENRICEELKEDIERKESIIGADYLNYLIRDQYLMMVDRKWLDHLENMEALREAVYLRSYAQKNPLTEYKVEGFQIFESMIDDIRQEIASRLHLIRIQLSENREQQPRPVRSSATVQSATHSSMGSFGASAYGAGTPPADTARQAARPQGDSVTVMRAQPKVGRNDPCPCGSGKKYKHCHGR